MEYMCISSSGRKAWKKGWRDKARNKKPAEAKWQFFISIQIWLKPWFWKYSKRSSRCPVCGILIYYLRKEGRDLVISQETVANGVENTMCVDFPCNMELKYNLIMHSLKKKKTRVTYNQCLITVFLCGAREREGAVSDRHQALCLYCLTDPLKQWQSHQQCPGCKEVVKFTKIVDRKWFVSWEVPQ